jgi:hypothetical protein
MTNAARGVRLWMLLSGVLVVSPGFAQQHPPPAELSEEVADAVVDFYNDPRRARWSGPTVIPADSLHGGDVAVIRGPLEIAGRLEGSVVMVNGDVLLRPGGAVTGDVLVVGGTVEGLTEATVGGEILVYAGRLHYALEGERMVRIRRSPARDTSVVSGESSRDTRFDFLVTSGNSYNRVEGLPITFGPRLRSGGPNPLRVHALAIYRTESGFTSDPDVFGYYVRGQQFLGGQGRWSVGATAHSIIDPIEDWHLGDVESGLAAFLFHRDFRDHYEREGFSGFTTWESGGGALSAIAELRWDRHRSLPAGSPLTLFENAEPWRAQPLVAEGRIGTVMLTAAYDTRSEVPDPASGWYLRGRLEQGFQAEIEVPRAYPALPGDPVGGVPPEAFGRFTTGFLDLRRYNRLSPDVRLNLRGLLGGSLTGAPLPPQRQHALGGEGSLPGYTLLSMDCGAREAVYRRSDTPATAENRAFPYYGCDAFTLLQMEVRGKLDFKLDLDSAPWDDDEGEELGLGWNIAPDWAFFANGGSGWSFGDRPDEPFRADVGVGLLIERIGIFLAVPLTGDSGVNVFVRLGPRF